MPTVDQLRTRLVEKLKELFQLNQPDLDFGFYRIMHARSEQVMRYLEIDLPRIVAEEASSRNAQGAAEAFEQAQAKLLKELGAAAILADGALNPVFAGTPVGQAYEAARQQLGATVDSAAAEAQIYDHLYRFFERYYEDGDFISRRYDVRETETRAAPYAIPYSGEEVKLVWANMDQYYIKTTEYFSNFTFDLGKAEQVQAVQTELFAEEETDRTYRVHFQIAGASEGEHGNVKASDQTKRFFLFYAADPVGFDEQGELVCRFEFRPDPEKTGQDATWRDKRNGESVQTVLEALRSLAATDARAQTYLKLLETPAPTEKDAKRPLLAKYVNQYTARNTMDYFIHKHLGAFLRRELDFYIKNEVVRLDDLEGGADDSRTQMYLRQIRSLRRIAGKMIDFLAQLEDFQKRLWLKKKFVVETNYCITLDRVIAIEDESERTWLLEQIAANDAQREEWVRLFAIDEIEESTVGPGYSVPLTVEFLKANNKLVVDTQYLGNRFKARLLASIGNLEENVDGLLIHSDNFQALNLLLASYRNQFEAVYIDPPYNTGPTEIIYKNAYKDSSWLSLMQDRLSVSLGLLGASACFAIAIDDYEMPHLCEVVDQLFRGYDRQMVVVNHHPQGGMSSNISRTHEYMLLMVPQGEDILRGKAKSGDVEYRSFMLSGPGDNKSRSGRPNSFYAILVDPNVNRIVGIEPPPDLRQQYPTENTSEGYIRRYPINPSGEEKVWCRSYDSALKGLQNGEIVITESGTLKLAVDTSDKRYSLMSNWTDSRYNAGPHGTALVADIMGHREAFSYPKSIHTVLDTIEAMTYRYEAPTVLDFFAGSATTAHAMIALNRLDEGNRKYVLVEVGDYFDSVTMPRIQKVVYSKEWKDGKPTSRDTGTSHSFKYLRLESYEDCLNNLEFKSDAERDEALAANPGLAEDHLLHYMLDVETAGSPSLLNIDSFADPTDYRLKVKLPGSDAYAWRTVDLLETFNYLLGLRVQHIAAPQTFTAQFERPKDPELPEDQHTRLQIVKGTLREDVAGPWWFRQVEGWLPKDVNQPANGQRDNVFIVWRKLTGNLEQDNLVLDAWFEKLQINPKDLEYATIYVNGSNNLPNLRKDSETWKVRLIEEDFLRLMWDTEEA